MLFNSYLFVFVFFPAVLLVWYGGSRPGLQKLAQAALVLLSLVFYGYGTPGIHCADPGERIWKLFDQLADGAVW